MKAYTQNSTRKFETGSTVSIINISDIPKEERGAQEIGIVVSHDNITPNGTLVLKTKENVLVEFGFRDNHWRYLGEDPMTGGRCFNQKVKYEISDTNT